MMISTFKSVVIKYDKLNHKKNIKKFIVTVVKKKKKNDNKKKQQIETFYRILGITFFLLLNFNWKSKVYKLHKIK